MLRRVLLPAAANERQGFRQTVNTIVAVAIRIQATPRTETLANKITENAGPK